MLGLIVINSVNFVRLKKNTPVVLRLALITLPLFYPVKEVF